MNATELTVNRLNTTAFIAANPRLVTLIPRTRTQSGSGARWVDGVPRVPQVVRLIDTQNVGGLIAGIVATVDGQQRKQSYQLLLPHDGAVAVDDRFVIDGQGYEVLDLLVDNGYERRATVVCYG